MAERGGRPGTVRNILYKDAGATAEKALLFDIVADLYARVGLGTPEMPRSLATAKAKGPLGRDKRRIFNQFTRRIVAGDAPRTVVVGGPATGKGMLLEQVGEAIPDALSVNLAKELSPALFTLAQQLDHTSAFERLVAKLSPEQPFALQAELQQDVLKLLADAANARGRPVLLRAEASGTLSRLPLRDASSREVSISDWLVPFVTRLRVAVLAAVSTPPAGLSFQELRAPTHEEARRFLRQRLPDTPPERIETLLRRGGRAYGELSRLALLESIRADEGGEERLLADPQLGPLLHVLAALSPEADPTVPEPLLEAAMGRAVAEMGPSERALLERVGRGGDGPDGLRPAVRSLLPCPVPDVTLHSRALAFYREHDAPFRKLHHAHLAGANDELLDLLDADASRLALLPNLWAESEAWPPAQRERLAYMVVRYRSVLGDYVHPEAREALTLLQASDDAERSGWARVKMAEAWIDAGRFGEAERSITPLPSLEGDAQVEAMLVRAAIARWRGAYDEARAIVDAASGMPAAPLLEDRVRLWQGLVAKDAGRFTEALESLAAVRNHPLLAARARYQEGDLLTRLGRPEEGVERIRRALEGMTDTAPHEEQVRVRARLGTPLRHLGRDDEAAEALYSALDDVSNPFTRARIQSEAAIFEAGRGRDWSALRLAAEAEAYFRCAEERREEAGFRHRRTRFRLAAALWAHDTGYRYRAPFRGGTGTDALRAQRILANLHADVEPRATVADRETALLLDTIQLWALTLSPAEALDLLDAVPPGIWTDHRSQLMLSRAEALVRKGEPAQASAALSAVRRLPPAPGSHVWRGALEAQVQLALGRGEVAWQIVEELLGHPRPFRHALGFVWGRALVAHGMEATVEACRVEGSLLPLPEALALCFAEGRGPSRDGESPPGSERNARVP